MRLLKMIALGGGITAVVFSGYLWFTQVDNAVTPADERAIAEALGSSFDTPNADDMYFEDQVAFIRRVQDAVLGEVPVNAGIPHGQPREPDDLLARGMGLCFDRSRFIEKALRHHGFETRHIAIYSTEETGSALVSLLTPQISSHAVTEVKTSRGWLVVDSNERWLSLDKGYQPVSIEQLSEMERKERQAQLLHQPDIAIYADEFTFVYGLYSRHGMFYPPYDRVPDIHVPEFAMNLARLLP
ncbi:transglutaminase domain-containing protein [Halomonas icarae]|uniref:Transglutaminase-like domain-containing protein n=1 Tax=Halomonas icarae TaxID=2691040 RepID=A0A7X4VWF4_9GAMM|nr:transglutaminase domain-containing protein [Halomonas icarae]MDR5903031.1 transglutaminase domain-containing protein [Halomonas icarae]NAW11587.1 hypothetical protein [Halomonas icarae]